MVAAERCHFAGVAEAAGAAGFVVVVAAGAAAGVAAGVAEIHRSAVAGAAAIVAEVAEVGSVLRLQVG